MSGTANGYTEEDIVGTPKLEHRDRYLDAAAGCLLIILILLAVIFI